MEYETIVHVVQENPEISENDADSEKSEVVIKLGDSFSTFQDVDAIMARYGTSIGAKYYKRDSRKLETSMANNRMRGLQIHFEDINKALKYSSVNFACVFGGRPYKATGMATMNKKGFASRKHIQCEAEIRFKISNDGQTLVVHYVNEYHNHPMTMSKTHLGMPDVYECSPPPMKQRRLLPRRSANEHPDEPGPLCMISDVTSFAESSPCQVSPTNSECNEVVPELQQRNNGVTATRRQGKLVIQQCLSAELLLKQHHTDLSEAQYLDIGQGIVVYVCFLDGANDKTVDIMANAILNIQLSGPTSNRVSILNMPGDILIVPQATLGGTPTGTVMQYQHNIVMEEGSELYELLIDRCKQLVDASNAQNNTQCSVKFGTYGKRQALTIVSNGPFTHVIDF